MSAIASDRPPGPGVPRSPAELTPEACTALVADRHPGVRITSVGVTEVSEVTNRHVRISWSAEPPGRIPGTAFAKLAPSDPVRAAQIAATGMGAREVRFYRDLAPTLHLRVPEVYGAADDPSDGAFVVLMEDLVASGCRVPDGTVGFGPDAVAGALEGLAELHARFAPAAARASVADWIRPNRDPGTYGAVRLQEALDRHRGRISDDFATIAGWYVADPLALQQVWHGGPVTVVHGDAHLGNCFTDGDRIGFLDWGIVQQAPAMRDVSYLLTMAMDPGVRRLHEADLLRHYLAARAAAGDDAGSFDDAWTAHRLQSAYTVVACCQIVTFPEGISDARRIFSEAFLARAEAAIADLEAVAALRSIGFA